ncbi:MAG: hypothetical protein MN733_27100, partial [Nitrososphaera sp.]|nr:hypothetical protein [Nitrososphaera sp.]
SEQQLEVLRNGIAKSEFFSLNDQYGDPYSDGALNTRTTVTSDGMTKTIVDDWGDVIPHALLEFQEMVDEMAGVDKWILCPDGSTLLDPTGVCEERV